MTTVLAAVRWSRAAWRWPGSWGTRWSARTPPRPAPPHRPATSQKTLAQRSDHTDIDGRRQPSGLSPTWAAPLMSGDCSPAHLPAAAHQGYQRLDLITVLPCQLSIHIFQTVSPGFYYSLAILFSGSVLCSMIIRLYNIIIRNMRYWNKSWIPQRLNFNALSGHWMFT